MFNGNSPSLADIAAVTGNNKDGWGDGNGWWVLIILFAIFGGWGNGFGGGYGNGGDRAFRQKQQSLLRYISRLELVRYFIH